MISIFPVSIFEKSRMSLISARSVLPALWISAACFLMLPFSVSCMISSFSPRIALSGVRISWDICERNRLFCSLAASAAIFSRSMMT